MTDNLPEEEVEVADAGSTESADDAAELAGFVVRRALGAGQLPQPLRHGFEALGIAEDVGDEILLLHPRQCVGLALQRFQQQFCSALDRGQRRFQLMGEVRRKGRDVIRPPRQLLRHVEEAAREPGKLSGAVMF